MRDDPLVIALVRRAGAGDQAAWNEIVDRYSPLVWSICNRRYRLDRLDAEDVNQSVWLLLVENLGALREPAALPGWLAKTTMHECCRVLRLARRHEHAELPHEDQAAADPDVLPIEEEIIMAERDAALRAAFAELSPREQDLLSMLISDPPCSYKDISAKLNVAVGSIGPMRARCLDKLRRSPWLTAIIDSRTEGAAGHAGKR